MKKTVIFIALACMSIPVASATTASAHSPKGKAYFTQVFSSFGGQFSSCLSFDNNETLNVQGYGAIEYRADELNTQPDAWQATAGASPPFGFVLAFHGTVGGNAGQTIIANGINSDGGTFILQGVLDPRCAATALLRSGASPYKR